MSRPRCWQTCICGPRRPARPPSKAMIWRVVTDADAGAFDAAVGTWLMSSLSGEQAGQGEAAGADRDDPAELMPVRLDGKTVRGARDAVGNQRHHHGELSQYTQQFYEPYARYPAPVFAVPGNHDGDPLPGASSLDGCLRVMATPSRSPLHPSPCPAPRTPQPLRLFTLALLNQQVGPALQRCPFVRCAVMEGPRGLRRIHVSARPGARSVWSRDRGNPRE